MIFVERGDHVRWFGVTPPSGEEPMANQVRIARDDDGTIRPSLASELEFDQVRSALKGIRHGEVRVIIQDGVIVQIERVEKLRLS